MIGLFGRQGPPATLRQHSPQMTRKRCTTKVASLIAGIEGKETFPTFSQGNDEIEVVRKGEEYSSNS